MRYCQLHLRYSCPGERVHRLSYHFRTPSIAEGGQMTLFPLFSIEEDEAHKPVTDCGCTSIIVFVSICSTIMWAY
jgi:hypothetical protein